MGAHQRKPSRKLSRCHYRTLDRRPLLALNQGSNRCTNARDLAQRYSQPIGSCGRPSPPTSNAKPTLAGGPPDAGDKIVSCDSRGIAGDVVVRRRQLSTARRRAQSAVSNANQTPSRTRICVIHAGQQVCGPLRALARHQRLTCLPGRHQDLIIIARKPRGVPTVDHTLLLRRERNRPRRSGSRPHAQQEPCTDRGRQQSSSKHHKYPRNL